MQIIAVQKIIFQLRRNHLFLLKNKNATKILLVYIMGLIGAFRAKIWHYNCKQSIKSHIEA